ncbi:MAG: hypothetical protein M1822_006482 [Bathelium mastoideum]|nr:MAG: hypothetical protein M1822_006482 [Bathelium mastoideum]
MECIVERTILGRPSAKRVRQAPVSADSLGTRAEQNSYRAESTPTPSVSEIKDYMYSEEVDPGPEQNTESRGHTRPSKQEVFQSMVDPASFFAAVLAKNKAFGAGLSHRSLHWDKPLPFIVGEDLAASMDRCLVWHRFFLPQLPTLVHTRNRLISHVSTARNVATELLFALLCLTALEISETIAETVPHVARSLRLAISSFGQSFITDPPTHQDSIVVCLFLAEFKPTVLVNSQHVARAAAKSALYITLAYRIAERLESLPGQRSFDANDSEAATSSGLDCFLTYSLQGLQVLCHDAFLEGPIIKPLRAVQCMVDRMKPYVEIYRTILQTRECSPTLVYHMQSMRGMYIRMEAVASMKKHWNNLDIISAIIQDTEKKCTEQHELSQRHLENRLHSENQDTITCAISLLETWFQSVSLYVRGLGIVYAMVLRVRSEAGSVVIDGEIYDHEAIQLGSQIIGTANDKPGTRMRSFVVFLNRIGVTYPSRVGDILEKLIRVLETSRLDGVAIRLPIRHFVLEIVCHCKNLVENNVLQLKGFGKLHQNIDKQMDLFAKCAKRLEAMMAAPWHGIDTAFADGCVYAAGSKIIHGLRELVEGLRERVLERATEQGLSHALEIPPDFTTFQDYEWDFTSEGWNFWPHLGGLGSLETLQDWPDWSQLSGFEP